MAYQYNRYCITTSAVYLTWQDSRQDFFHKLFIKVIRKLINVQVLLKRKFFTKGLEIGKSKPAIPSFPAWKSYAQCGEDLLVQYIFNLRGITSPSYIDIGAHHPYYLSNTALFYEQGCRGINVEANPELLKNFKEFRPEDINLNTGVGQSDGELDFYIMQENSLSTFSKDDYDFMHSKGKSLSEIKKIKLTTIAEILRCHFEDKFPDFMSIDVEGMDLAILQSINFNKSFPKIICVEAAEYSPIGAGKRRNELIDFLQTKGYYEYANTNLNAIMVKNEFWFI